MAVKPFTLIRLETGSMVMVNVSGCCLLTGICGDGSVMSVAGVASVCQFTGLMQAALLVHMVHEGSRTEL